MRRLLVLLACLGLAAPAVAASGSFSLPATVSRWGQDSTVVALRMRTDSTTDPITAYVATIDYDGDFARFVSVENGADAPTWEILAVNDNGHYEGCRPTPPTRRVTVVAAIPITNPWDCTPGIFDGEALRFLFSVSGCGTTPLVLRPECEAPGLTHPNHVATCDGLTLAPFMGNLELFDGSITRAECATDVAAPAVDWGRVKGLYR